MVLVFARIFSAKMTTTRFFVCASNVCLRRNTKQNNQQTKIDVKIESLVRFDSVYGKVTFIVLWITCIHYRFAFCQCCQWIKILSHLFDQSRCLYTLKMYSIICCCCVFFILILTRNTRPKQEIDDVLRCIYEV